MNILFPLWMEFGVFSIFFLIFFFFVGAYCSLCGKPAWRRIMLFLLGYYLFFPSVLMSGDVSRYVDEDLLYVLFLSLGSFLLYGYYIYSWKQKIGVKNIFMTKKLSTISVLFLAPMVLFFLYLNIGIQYEVQSFMANNTFFSSYVRCDVLYPNTCTLRQDCLIGREGKGTPICVDR